MHFVLFGNCVAVRGASRSSIYDLQLGRLQFIPNLLHEFIEKGKTLTVEQIRERLGEDRTEGVEDVLEYLENENYGLFTKIPDQFPQIDHQLYDASEVNNVIIELGQELNYDFGNLVAELEALGCQAVEIRSQFSPLELLRQVLHSFENSRVKEIVLHYNEMNPIHINEWVQLRASNLRLNQINIYCTERRASHEFGNLKVDQYPNPLNNDDCGMIKADYWTLNPKFFTESLQANSCLNKKISIDPFGRLKSCPSLPKTFGSLQEHSLKEMLERSEIKKLWKLRKDDVNVCRDCEFRYACHDCRAYTLNDEAFEKPAKCKYDPYTMEWN